MTPALSPHHLRTLPFATPFLYMDLTAVRDHFRAFITALPEADIHYAMKCNPDTWLLHYLANLGSKFEIASSAELKALQAVGVSPAAILFSNPVKVPAHIREAFAGGVNRFAFDSEEELHKLAQTTPGANVYIRLATRPANSTVPSEGKFGVTTSRAVILLKQARALGLTPYGITFHVGSQMENPAAWQQAIADSGQVMHTLQRAGIRISMLDIGGGFPAAHKPGLPTITVFGKTITAALKSSLPYWPSKIAVEPGRGLVSDAGVMVATIIGAARRGAKQWLHLDVGAFNGFMEALETSNQLRFPVADSRQSVKRAPYNLTGPSCDSQDTILYDQELSTGLAAGDKVFIYTAGAYTTSYASTFNGFPKPTVHYAHARDLA